MYRAGMFASKDIDLTVKRDTRANEHITLGSNSYEKVKTFKYIGSLLTNRNSIHEEIKNVRKFTLLFSPSTFVFSTTL